MHRLYQILTFWLLSTAAFCSCSVMDAEMSEGNKVIISGSVCDIDTKQPLESVKILFKAYDTSGVPSSPINEINVYTDSNGAYNLMSDEYDRPVTCVIITEAESYESVRKEVFVNWEGTSYDREKKTFFVNDCDFHLSRK